MLRPFLQRRSWKTVGGYTGEKCCMEQACFDDPPIEQGPSWKKTTCRVHTAGSSPPRAQPRPWSDRIKKDTCVTVNFCYLPGTQFRRQSFQRLSKIEAEKIGMQQKHFRVFLRHESAQDFKDFQKISKLTCAQILTVFTS